MEMATYGINNSDAIASYVQTIYEMATLAARDRDFMTNLVEVFNDNRGTAIRSRSEYGTATYKQISDSDDLVSETFTPSVQNSLTPYMYGDQFMLTDQRIRNDPFNLQRDAARELGEGAAKHVNKSLIAQFSSLTAGTIGSNGGTLTVSDLLQAVATLQMQNARPPYYGVIQYGHQYHLGTVLAPGGGVSQTNAPELQNAFARNAYLGNLFGVMWFATNDITSGTAAIGAVFSREAIAFDLRVPFRIEPDRDASYGGGAWELDATMTYAAGVWRPDWGVALRGTSVLPT